MKYVRSNNNYSFILSPLMKTKKIFEVSSFVFESPQSLMQTDS